jgi:hypothetical protein
MSFNYSPDGPGFTVPRPIEDRTAELAIVRTVAPTPVAAAPADKTLTTILDAVDKHAAEIRRLAATTAAKATRERVRAAIADLQQLDAHLSEGDAAKREAETATAFNDWATAPGGKR